MSQIPVFRGDEVVGTMEESDILRLAISDRDAIDRPVDGWMKPPLPIVNSDEHVDVITRLLVREPAVLVRRDGQIQGILTRYDMLQFIARGE